MKNIRSIVWPADAKAACNLYLEFAIGLLDRLGVQFPDSMVDPRATARGYISGSVSEEDYKAQARVWWKVVEAEKGIANFSDLPTLTARLALCLLRATPDDVARLPDAISWLIEVLQYMGFDGDGLIRGMEAFFAFEE